jgi:hypothetical protein
VRDYWEQEFATLLNSLRPFKGEGDAAPVEEKKKTEMELPNKEDE